MATGVLTSQPRDTRRSATFARAPMPISTTTVSDPGAIEASTRSTDSRSEPVSTTKPDDTPRCVTGMPASAGAAMAVGDARNNLERNAGALQRERFFAAAAEHERIAAFQADHSQSLLRSFNHQPLDLALRRLLAAGALADVDAQGVRPPARTPRRDTSASYRTTSASRKRRTAFCVR